MINIIYNQLSESQQKCIIELMIAMTDHPTTSPLRAIGEATKLYGPQCNAPKTMDYVTTALLKYNEMKELPSKRKQA